MADRLRERFGERAVGMVLALVLEALLILLIVMMGRTGFQPAGSDSSIASFDVSQAAEQAPAQEEQAATQPAVQVPATPSEQTPDSQLPPPAPTLERALSVNPVGPPVVTLTPEEFASTDISNLPRRRPDAPSGPAYGPPAPAANPADSQVVGTAPDGSPMYGARWYQEPTDQEMAGYLSTANPGSWALIACKTAPGWRVEDCVGLEEYPTGSNLQRAVLAAAWQFQVRPPRRGNASLVGSWVRIRITYDRRVR
ncbi:hypothetical protein GCM10009127_14200 [Alteraurantiacibacter aestuarii]|nr:hypothetical protein [Alteraurantiacibacter aestuarii]